MEAANVKTPPKKFNSTHVRNLVAFWFFGLCNNFPYVIMLSAAHDILAKQKPEPLPDDAFLSSQNSSSQSLSADVQRANHSHMRECNDLSTGAVLLADIVPALVVKLLAPFYVQKIPYGIKIFVVVLFMAASFPIMAFSDSVTLSLLGVVCASISSGIGEVSFLALSANYDKDTVSTWSSGTGGAGIFGALSYAGLTQIGLTSREVMLVMLIMPIILTTCYWIVLVKPPSVHRISLTQIKTWVEPKSIAADYGTEKDHGHDRSISIRKKLELTWALQKFVIPLVLVYYAEYLVNQGLHELVFFPGIWLVHSSQYRWYQVLYQLGVFISRSSVNVIQVPQRFLIVFPILQIGVATVMLFEAYYLYMPSIWIVFGITLFEGFLGGGAYVNTFYRIRQDIDPRYVEFSLGTASIADTFGVMCAAFTAIPVHNLICHQPLPY